MRGVLAIVVVCVSLSVSLGMVSRPAAAAQTWTVTVGGGIKGTAVVSNSFTPRAIEVAVGDTVTWAFQQPWALHTVAFVSGEKAPELLVPEGNKLYFNPQVFFPAGGKTYDGAGYRNSGVPPEGEKPTTRFSYSLTFTEVGTYAYLCLLHPGMSGTVTVKQRVSASPASAQTRGRGELAAILKAGQAAFAKWNPERKGNEVILPMVGNPQEGWSNFRFSRQPLVIKRGTTVTWTVRDPFEVHTVTFSGRQNPPELIVVEPQKQGPPKLLLNPKAGTPSQTKTYDGAGYVNSGILFPAGAPGNPPTSFSLTFTKAGRYEYYCIIHAPWQMKGTVIVQ